MNKKELRQHFRKKRKALTYTDREHASFDVCELFTRTSLFQNSKNFALYLANDNDNELDPQHLIQHIWSAGKKCYLPVLDDNNLLFTLYEKDTTLIKNKYKILEPTQQSPHISPHISLNELDVMFLPLVAFTMKGERLGMGAGYYDRTLATVSSEHLPYLVGLAYDCQSVDTLPCDPWDVNLNAILTPSGFHEISNNRR